MSRRAWYSDDPAARQLERDQPVIDELNKLVDRYPRWGFWKYFYALRMAGQQWNHKRVWPIYCAMTLNQKRRAKRRLPDRPNTPLGALSMPNHTWSFDFINDTLYSGHRYRVLNIIDEGTREALDISIGISLPAGTVMRVLEMLIAEHEKPRRIRVDNGAEMTSTTFIEWCEQQQIQIIYIQPGKPSQAKTLISNVLTGGSGTRFWMRISSEHSVRCGTLPGHGWSATTRNDLMRHWGMFRLRSSSD